MREMIASIYNAVSDIVQPFKTIYPYQDIEADVDNGVVTFAPVKISNLTLAGEELQADESLLVDSVARICFQVDIYKSISWNDKDISAFDMAEKLQTYLKSSQARDKFYNDYKYELMPIWSDITFQADFNTYKKWVQVAQFEIFITKMSSVILSDTPLKNIVLSVSEVNTLENNKAYSNFANKFLKTN